MSVDHYENFPVASWLCPPALRPPIAAIYAFARTADDLADEGDMAPADRLALLGEFRADLIAAQRDGAASSHWPQVFGPLLATIRTHRLPTALLTDLLDAFEQDVVKHSYIDRPELMDYCRRSANPVGRLLLHLYKIDDPVSLIQSDAICSALQLANFWQDLSVDTTRGRIYLPATDCARYRIKADGLLARRDTPEVRQLVADMVAWARQLMLSGAPLVHRIPGRAGWELRLVVQGGLRILDKIEAMQFATLQRRPTLHWYDFVIMVWRAVRMRPPRTAIANASA